MEVVLQQLQSLMYQAGEIALDLKKKINPAEHEGLFPVTIADKAISDFLYPELKKIQNIPILDEERADDPQRVAASRIWVVDPIDGTKDYVADTGDYAVMLALVEDNRVVVSMVYQPTKKILYYASKGNGAFMVFEKQKTQLQLAEINNNTRLLTSRFHNADIVTQFAQAMDVIAYVPQGSMGLKMAAIAANNAELTVYFTAHTGEWDSAPGSLLVTEAGGVVSDLQGNELLFNKPQPRNTTGVLAAHPSVHKRAVAVINSFEYSL